MDNFKLFDETLKGKLEKLVTDRFNVTDDIANLQAMKRSIEKEILALAIKTENPKFFRLNYTEIKKHFAKIEIIPTKR